MKRSQSICSQSMAGILAAVLLSAAVGAAYGDDAPVTREEFNKMMKEMQQLRAEVAELKKQPGAATQPAASAGGPELQQLREEVTALKQQRKEDQADSEERRRRWKRS